MLDGINKIRQLYLSRGVTMSEIRADGELKCLEHELQPCVTNIAAPGEHVPEIERSVRTTKESTHTLQHDLPFQKQPKMMTEANVYCSIKHLDVSHPSDGISKIFLHLL